MQKLLLLAIIAIFMCSCGSSKVGSSSKQHLPQKTSKTRGTAQVHKIISYAKTFKGTRYKYGGTTKKGMDCSGLVYTAFGKEEIKLPRVSRDMAKKGKPVSLSKSVKGDLLFFTTSKSKKSINHVGLVIGSKRGEILFIHSTTSKGVIISSMEERYWKSAFVKARRVI